MGLSRHAREEVDKRLDEIFMAFMEGSRSDGTLAAFQIFLEQHHETLSLYYVEWHTRKLDSI